MPAFETEEFERIFNVKVKDLILKFQEKRRQSPNEKLFIVLPDPGIRLMGREVIVSNSASLKEPVVMTEAEYKYSSRS